MIENETFSALFPGHRNLTKSFEMLRELKALLDGLSEHRRRKILIASQLSGASFPPLESLEMEWDRLADDYRDLWRLYEQSSMFQRSFLSSHATQFRIDTVMLEARIREFYKDRWNTTMAGDRSLDWAIFRRNTA